MKTLLPFLASIFLPGLGQLLIKDYWKGILILTALIGSSFFITFISIQIFYFICLIWSLTEIYMKLQKTDGKKSATRYLIFSLVLAVVILPGLFYLFYLSAWQGGEFVKNEFLNESRTKKELKEISNALDIYHNNQGHYPANYLSFVNSKPIWSSWKYDNWENNYKYSLIDSSNYVLISSGKDQQFGTDDDIIKETKME